MIAEDGPQGAEPTEAPAGANGPVGPGLEKSKSTLLTPDDHRRLSARIGRLRAYVKSAIYAGDWAVANEAIVALRVEEEALAAGHRRIEGDTGQRLHDLERAFAALLAGTVASSGQKHPHAEALVADKPVRFTFAVDRAGKLHVNFTPLEVDG